MTKEVMIGSTPVKLTANAATSLRFKQLFGKDLLVLFQDQGTNLDASVVKELGFVEAMQAKGSDFIGISMNDCIEWLEQFEELEFLNSAATIVEVWVDTNKTSSKPKKK